MNAFTTLLMMFVALASILSSSELRAADTKTTTITVKGMHCGGCAKKVAAKLKAVPGVDNVNVDASTSQASLTPQANKVPSPRALWEAVEKAGYETVKIAGPSGVFTEKPKS